MAYILMESDVPCAAGTSLQSLAECETAAIALNLGDTTAAPFDTEVYPAGCQVLSSALYFNSCLLYTSPSPRDRTRSRMPSSA